MTCPFNCPPTSRPILARFKSNSSSNFRSAPSGACRITGGALTGLFGLGLLEEEHRAFFQLHAAAGQVGVVADQQLHPVVAQDLGILPLPGTLGKI